MKHIKVLLASITMMTILSCGSGSSNQPANAEGFSNIENEIKSEFGDQAYYTDLTVTYNKSIGNIIGVTVTDDPKSLKMGQWNLTQDSWKQNSEITLEVPNGTKASDYMFQLDDNISLTKLGGIVAQSIQKLKDEKGLKNPTLSIAGLNFPDDGDVSKAQYLVNLKPENGGTSFMFYYTLNGELIKMDY